VRRRDGRALFLQRANGVEHWPGQWDLPGGKVDEGELFDLALLREIEEETGLRAELGGLVGATEWIVGGVHVVFLVMSATVDAGDVVLEEEQAAHRWVPADEVAALELCEPFEALVPLFVKELERDR